MPVEAVAVRMEIILVEQEAPGAVVQEQIHQAQMEPPEQQTQVVGVVVEMEPETLGLQAAQVLSLFDTQTIIQKRHQQLARQQLQFLVGIEFINGQEAAQ